MSLPGAIRVDEPRRHGIIELSPCDFRGGLECRIKTFRQQSTGATSEAPHPCRPSSALMPNHLGETAEPVLFFYRFFVFFFLLYLYGVPLPAPCKPARHR
jgi:hypothetical protein